MELRIGKHFMLTKKLGSGAFGDIYLTINTKTKEEYATKLENVNCKHPQLLFESKLYQYLHQDSISEKGIPKIHFSGIEGEFNVMVMDLLGKSLEDLFQLCNKKFSLKTVLTLADQMIQRIEFVHGKHFLHRDIKPDNFLMGINNKKNKVKLIIFFFF